MSRKRIYHPSDTHLALHPPSDLIDCPCGVRFAARPPSLDSEDNPTLCLTCNRKSWSRLWNGNQPVDNASDTDNYSHDSDNKRIVDATEVDFDLISDNDIGEVIPIWRPRR